MEEKKYPSGLESRKKQPRPLDELAAELLDQVKPVLNEEGQTKSAELRFIPPADVWESDAAYFVAIYLPGIERDMVNLDVKDGYLIVSGERNIDPDLARQKTRQMESSYGYFQRRIKLNIMADTEGIKARMQSGILMINIPKLQSQEYIRNIKVA